MSFNGSGTFNINSAGQPVVTGTVISSTVFNAFTADIGTGLSTCVTKDGQTTTTAAVPFAVGINVTSPIVTPSTTFALVNTTATTVNFAGAATTLNIGAATGTTTLGNALVGSIVTDATTPTTGAWKTAGGLGVAKALWVGGLANVAGAVTLQSTLNVTGAITPSQTAGIVGTTTNNTADAGAVGQYSLAQLLFASRLALTTDTNRNVTSLSLTAGDWDVSGVIHFHPNAATTRTYVTGGTNTVSITLGDVGTYAQTGYPAGTDLDGIEAVMVVPTTRISIAATTTVYLIAASGFAVSTMEVYGALRARRVR